MAKQLKLRRGTTAQHSTFTGASGEVTVDTDKKALVVHDGATAGGVPMATEAALAGKQAADSELTTLSGMSASRAAFLAANLPFSWRNRIINGDMRIDQRNSGAAVTANNSGNYFSVDRFFGTGQLTDGVFTLQQSSVAPAGFKNSLLATVTTADTSLGVTQQYAVGQSVEGFNVADLGWGSSSAQTVTLSFWVRSSLTGTFGGSFVNSAFNRSCPFSYSISAANTFEYKTVTITGDTAGTWLSDNGVGIRVLFSLGAGSTYLGTAGTWAGSYFVGATGQTQSIATSGATFYITGVQLEAGSTATPFEYVDYSEQLQRCQRYYEKLSMSGSSLYGTAWSVGASYATWLFKTTKRATPTISLVSSNGTGQNTNQDFTQVYITASGYPYFGNGSSASSEL